MNEISGNIIDVLNERIYSGRLIIKEGRITEIIEDNQVYDNYIIPGFIDSHVHIESSMLVPSEFARLAVVHGTVATVSDPHEIANVLGIDGIKFMIENGKKVPFKFYFGAPPCVPATIFETAGAKISPSEIEELFREENLKYLSEVMNFPGVINDDPDMIEKIRIAQKYDKVVDGHAPGLSGKDLEKYINCGISTDHECFTKEEAQEKLDKGMKVIIREGSAAKNYTALIDLLSKNYQNMMFCSDDKHPDNLEKGHINELVKKSIDRNLDLMQVLRVACVNPVLHYKLDVGLLQKNDPADFVVIDSPTNFKVLHTFINGKEVARNGKTLINSVNSEIINNFNVNLKNKEDFKVSAIDEKRNLVTKIKVIEALDGQLITNKLILAPRIIENNIVSDVENDILKIVVVNRYSDSTKGIGFIRNFGLKAGAIASSVAHDSHNIICVGTNDEEITNAVNLIIKNKGGVCIVDKDLEEILPLPIGGIMTNIDGYQVSKKYSQLDKQAKSLGTKLNSPFMTLSFMALLVIPNLKLSDKGLFDGEEFNLTQICVD